MRGSSVNPDHRLTEHRLKLVRPSQKPCLAIDRNKQLLLERDVSHANLQFEKDTTMIGCFRKIGSRAMALPFACAVLTGFLLETSVHSALAGLKVDTQIRVGMDPWGMAFSPDGNYLYVANYGSNTLSVIDTVTKQVSATITLSPGAGGFLSSVVVTPDGSTVFVLGAQSTIAVISTSTNTVINTISAGPTFGTGMAITPDGAHLFVSNNQGTVSIINVATYQIEKTLTVGLGAWTVAVSPDGTSAYVEAAGSGPSAFYLTKIDVASETIVAPQLGVGLFKDGISTGLAFSPDSQIVYVPGVHLDVLQLDANTGELQATFVLSSERQSLFGGIQASPDGKFLWVAETTAKVVATINTLTGKVVTTPLGGARHPNSVVISPDGTHLCTANSGTPRLKVRGTVSVISR
jgi:YVTN family beta-propeller protein